MAVLTWRIGVSSHAHPSVKIHEYQAKAVLARYGVLARSIGEVEQLTKDMLGMTLVTHQTGPEGKKVGRVLIEEGLQIDRELYLSIVIDRASASPVVIASAAGGMDIEEVAATHPEKILREAIEGG